VLVADRRRWLFGVRDCSVPVVGVRGLQRWDGSRKH